MNELRLWCMHFVGLHACKQTHPCVVDTYICVRRLVRIRVSRTLARAVACNEAAYHSSSVCKKYLHAVASMHTAGALMPTRSRRPACMLASVHCFVRPRRAHMAFLSCPRPRPQQARSKVKIRMQQKNRRPDGTVLRFVCKR